MKLKRIIAALIAVVILLPTVVSAEESDEYKLYDNIVNFIQNSYIDETITKDEIIKNAIDNLVKENPEMLVKLFQATFDGLDQYSEFYTAEEFQAFLENLNKEFCGIGVVIQKQGDYIAISSCTENGPAAKVGVHAHDKIIKVNGEDVVGRKIDDVRSLIVGDKGTSVELTVLRSGQELTFTIVRDEVKINTVDTTILKDNIAYVRISNFAESTDEEFKAALEKLDEQGIVKIIIDMRDNPGGYLTSAVNVAKLIVPKGIITQLKFRQEENNITYMSDLENPKYKLAVLVNSNTASAAEVLAGAIYDSGVGVLIGDTTYGKGVVQDMYRLPTGQAMKLTTGYYLTRNGTSINGKGIEPNEIVLNSRRPVDNTKYVQFDYKTKYTVGDNGDGVKAAEQRLSLLGYYVGDVDNEFTEDTEDAVKAFQSDSGLFSYGVLDITTQVAINNKFLQMEEVIDNQLKRAYEVLGGNVSNLDLN
ncbi:MAG: S41 family peptidase [Clostridia bacterium]|nr:S41 family peptidase [Clostridia bacterium]